jgi:hypothetical protein
MLYAISSSASTTLPAFGPSHGHFLVQRAVDIRIVSVKQVADHYHLAFLQLNPLDSSFMPLQLCSRNSRSNHPDMRRRSPPRSVGLLCVAIPLAAVLIQPAVIRHRCRTRDFQHQHVPRRRSGRCNTTASKVLISPIKRVAYRFFGSL